MTDTGQRDLALDTNLGTLTAALSAAGLTLSADDEKIAGWLSGWEPETVQTIIGWINQARGTGLAGSEHSETAPAAPEKITGTTHADHPLTEGEPVTWFDAFHPERRTGTIDEIVSPYAAMVLTDDTGRLARVLLVKLTRTTGPEGGAS